MSRETLLATVLVLGVAVNVVFAQPRPRIDVSDWKIYRNEAMGFETRYPSAWHERSAKATGREAAMLSETPQAEKPQLAVQFWVQRKINPQGLPIEQWYADQLRRMNGAPLPTGKTSIGGRPTIRTEAVVGLTRQFQFFTSLSRTDIFEITVRQPSSQTELDPTYRTLISSVRFIH
jgi:hypothetical protein